jgi:type IV secretory pathway VirB2 component (pilin)
VTLVVTVEMTVEETVAMTMAVIVVATTGLQLYLMAAGWGKEKGL